MITDEVHFHLRKLREQRRGMTLAYNEAIAENQREQEHIRDQCEHADRRIAVAAKWSICNTCGRTIPAREGDKPA